MKYQVFAAALIVATPAIAQTPHTVTLSDAQEAGLTYARTSNTPICAQGDNACPPPQYATNDAYLQFMGAAWGDSYAAQKVSASLAPAVAKAVAGDPTDLKALAPTLTKAGK